MNREQGTGKYEQVLVRCRGIDPIPTAVAHPCESTALIAALEAAQKGLITPILVGPATKIQEVAKQSGITLGETRIVDAPHSHALGREGRGAGSSRPGRAAHEGEPAHRRAPERRRCQGNGPSHRTPHQPCVHHGHPDLPQGPDRHRRGHQYCADAGGQGPHLLRTPSISQYRSA